MAAVEDESHGHDHPRDDAKANQVGNHFGNSSLRLEFVEIIIDEVTKERPPMSPESI